MKRIYKQNPNVEGAPLNEEAILFDPTSTNFFMLNRTSSLIWESLAEPSTVEALAGRICSEFDDVLSDVALQDVESTLDQMLSLGLITSTESS